jgi:hypothetical protein
MTTAATAISAICQPRADDDEGADQRRGLAVTQARVRPALRDAACVVIPSAASALVSAVRTRTGQERAMKRGDVLSLLDGSGLAQADADSRRFADMDCPARMSRGASTVLGPEAGMPGALAGAPGPARRVRAEMPR